MDQKFVREETIRQYLLGTLSEPQSSEIEQELFFDEELSRTADLIEDEIIEHYLDQELDPHERTAFETHFLRPAVRREKLDLARLLRHGLESLESSDDSVAPKCPPAPRNSLVWLRNYSVAATALVSMIPIIYLAVALHHVRIENKILAAKVQEAKNSPITSIPLSMQYGVSRGHSSLPHIEILPPTRTIKVDLILPGRFAELFNIRLLDRTHGEAREIWSTNAVPPATSQPRLIFDMPSQRIRTGTYDIVASDPISDASVTYPFDAVVNQSSGPPK